MVGRLAPPIIATGGSVIFGADTQSIESTAQAIAVGHRTLIYDKPGSW